MKAFRGLLLVPALAAAQPAAGRFHLNAVGCLGEVGYALAYDVGSSTTLPQIGFGVEYRARYWAIYNIPTIGYYVGRPVLEDYLGGELGADIAWARPALTGGIGIQSYHRQDFRGMSDAFDRKLEVRYPLGLGFRLRLFQSFYGEWQGRTWKWRERDGIPAWKMEFGMRVI